MKTPPLLPAETLHRVLRVANLDGLSVLLVAGLLALVSAASGDYLGTVLGLLVAAAGAIELHGAGLLGAGDRRGVSWLLFSQPFLLAILLGVCAWQLTHFDPVAMAQLKSLLQASSGNVWKTQAAQAGFSETEYLTLLRRTVYWGVALVTLLYQGGMTLYYLRRRDALLAAVAEPFEEIA